jgi:hypothetical protein
MTKEQLLTRTLEDLRNQYPLGLYEYLFKLRQDLFHQLISLEHKIDQLHLDTNASIDQLKAVLRDYRTFHMKAVKEFRHTGQLGLNLSQIRQEMVEERVRA